MVPVPVRPSGTQRVPECVCVKLNEEAEYKRAWPGQSRVRLILNEDRVIGVPVHKTTKKPTKAVTVPISVQDRL